ncbi:unnamed protein product [Owenia fusiformis]|uniref:Uncharacterized protein n=1 Tax=Owenia fusiformis TaxID=6347 RepID=A0A8S4NBE0_OWEFU|nr:unnamed protein product [Owenia fusiformis]
MADIKVIAVKEAGYSADNVAVTLETDAAQPAQYNPPPTYGGVDAAPPTYESSTGGPGDAPPSYDSIYGRLKGAKDESDGNVDFAKKFAGIVCGTLGCTICVGLVLAIPISMIVMGSVHLHNCPRERMIPIYLIVAGVFGIIKNLSNFGQRIKNRKEGNDEENAKTNPFDGILNCFLFAWFIAGNVWIYRTYRSYNCELPRVDAVYCDCTLYLYAFWITTATYILIALSCCCVCFSSCLICMFGGSKK